MVPVTTFYTYIVIEVSDLDPMSPTFPEDWGIPGGQSHRQRRGVPAQIISVAGGPRESASAGSLEVRPILVRERRPLVK
jgi:hypothetical protein